VVGVEVPYLSAKMEAEEAHPWAVEEVVHRPLEVAEAVVDHHTSSVVVEEVQYHSSLVVVEEILLEHLQWP
jgi:hypothetical protein